MATEQSWPFIDWKAWEEYRESGGSLTKLTGKFLVSEAASYLSDTLEETRRRGHIIRKRRMRQEGLLGRREEPPVSMFSEYVYGGLSALLNVVSTVNRHAYKSKLAELFPKAAAWFGFSEGTTVTDEMYTVEMPLLDQHGNELDQRGEFVIAIKPKKTDRTPRPEDPTVEQLKAGIQSIKQNGKSPFNETGQNALSHQLYNDNFDLYSIKKYTRGDSERVKPPLQLRGWIARRDLFITHAAGRVVDTQTVNVQNIDPADNTNYVVRRYKKPGRIRNWWFNVVGDKVYDTLDYMWDMIQHEKLPEQALQKFLKEEFKVIDKVARIPFRNYSRLPLFFDRVQGMGEHNFGYTVKRTQAAYRQYRQAA